MNNFQIIIMVIANFVFQSTILPSFKIFGVVPNTALVFIILISLNKGKYYGGFVGMAMGFMQDIIFSYTIGINAFIYFFVGYVIGSIRDNVARENIVIPIICSFLSTIFYNVLYFLFMFFLSREIPFVLIMKEVLMIEIIYNIIFTIIIYKIMAKIFAEPSLRFGRR